MNNNFIFGDFDAVVIGAGHAGCEAALALARTGQKTALLTINLDNIAYMACNPSVGGTAKGHLVREVDALGGEIGLNADFTALQMKMLNRTKGAAVQSLRAQADKRFYHSRMKAVLERQENLQIIQAEASEILVSNGNVCGVQTTIGGLLNCRAAVVASGVYLNSRIVAGDFIKAEGPSGFSAATELTNSLIKLGFKIRRFKTGTPARLKKSSIDFSKCEIQEGETNLYPFSFMSDGVKAEQTPCYLTYTNSLTHEIINNNLDRSPLYNGTISSTGTRYCPSIETKVQRFPDKERHQIFLEPEGADNDEIYVQGMSTSLPHDVQIAMYRTISGLEYCEFMRFAYAIEYDCIDSLDLLPTLAYKKLSGLYTAGQINGTSGYEEAAAQGLIAGLNASLYLRGEKQLVLSRSDAYIGVLIDDLVTKGTVEPYRMMTSRAEYRIFLRQDNADMRLTEIGREKGLVTTERYDRYLKRKAALENAKVELDKMRPYQEIAEFLLDRGFELKTGLSFADMIKKGIPLAEIIEYFNVFTNLRYDEADTLETDCRYEGYLKRGLDQIEKAKRLESKLLPEDIDYNKIEGLRIEAREKLTAVRPLNLGQAERISGVNPADIAVLMVYLKK